MAKKISLTLDFFVLKAGKLCYSIKTLKTFNSLLEPNSRDHVWGSVAVPDEGGQDDHQEDEPFPVQPGPEGSD